MVWFQIKVLENKIKRNEFSDRECLNYLFCYLFLNALTLGVIKPNSFYYDHWIVATRVIGYFAINMWGIFLTFKTNKSGDGRDYFKRFIAIYFVISLRLVIWFAAITVLIIVIATIIIGEHATQSFINSITNIWINMLSVLVLQLIVYLMMNNSFKRLSQNPS